MIFETYTTAYYAGSIEDRRSTIGYCIFLGAKLVIWMSKKLNIVVKSSAKSKYYAMAQGAYELL